MTDAIDLPKLARWLAGEFDNRPQAFDQPAWFVHLRLWHRPLPICIEGNLALFAEQANALYPDNPYRQRVLVLQNGAEGAIVQYYAFRQPDRFRGAGANPSLLAQLSTDDLEDLPGCRLRLSVKGTIITADPPAGARCCFQYDGEMRQVVLGFEASETTFRSYDKGVDPETGQALWGALMGPYEFTKCADFSSELV